MSRKDIIILTVLVNAGLLVILLISALSTKENYLVASSQEVASTILQDNENGMLPIKKEEAVASEAVQEESLAKMQEEILHKLPEIAESQNIASEEKGIENVQENVVVETPKAVEGPKFKEVRVKKGDTLDKIAKINHITVAEIIKINDLPNTFLRIGQLLKVPTKEKPSNSSNLEPDYYTIKCGDNCWTIALKHHMQVAELLKLNKLTKESAKKLKPGDKLRVR